MARPTARVLALLELLQTGGTWTVARLADRLQVDERTVRRYVAHLIDLDVPVRTVRGRYGGYRISPGYRLPPLMLTDEEAVAVLLGLRAGQRSGSTASTAVAADSAAAKISRVLPSATQRRLDALFETANDTAAGPTQQPDERADAQILLSIAEAARDRRFVTIDYESRGGRATRRQLAPYGIVAHSGRWYVVGHDDAHQEIRTFRLDRVTRCSPASGTFEIPVGFDPAGTVLDTLAKVPWAQPISVRVRGSAAEVARRLPPGLATVSDTDDSEWVRVSLRAERLDWVPLMLVGLGMPLIIDEPTELRQLMGELGARIMSYADGRP